MLTLENLEIELRKEAVHCSIPASTQDALRSLGVEGEPLQSAAALVRYLDETPLYTPARDRVLAQLLRTMKPGAGSPFTSLLLYAFLPTIRRLHCRVVAKAFTVDEEILADVLAATLNAIVNYDPARHSPHVQANVELNVLNAFHRKWAQEKKERAATKEAGRLARAYSEEGHVQTHPAWFFPGLKADIDAPLTPDELATAEEILGCLAGKGLLSRLEAELVQALCLHGTTSTQLGQDYAMDRRTVVRRVQRACRRIHQDFCEALGQDAARSEGPATICGQF